MLNKYHCYVAMYLNLDFNGAFRLSNRLIFLLVNLLLLFSEYTCRPSQFLAMSIRPYTAAVTDDLIGYGMRFSIRRHGCTNNTV